MTGCALQVKLGDNFALWPKTLPWVSQKAKFESPFLGLKIKNDTRQGIKFELQITKPCLIYQG